MDSILGLAREAHAVLKATESATPGSWSWNEGEEGYELMLSHWRSYQAAPFSEECPHPGFVPNGSDFTRSQRHRILADEKCLALSRVAAPKFARALLAVLGARGEKSSVNTSLGVWHEGYDRGWTDALTAIFRVIEESLKDA